MTIVRAETGAILIRFSLRAIIFLIFIFPFCVPANLTLAQDFYFTWEEPKKTIVFLDPGHGGRDLGVRGTTLILEKNITLKISELLAKKLSQDKRLDIVTSRSDDIDLNWLDRMSMANFNKPKVYVGIHAGGGNRPKSHAMKVYLWGERKSAEPEGANKTDAAEKPSAWGRLNSAASAGGMDLAKRVKRNLERINNKRGVDIVQTDRLGLGGLTMPAIIVEAVDLANPEDELKLQDLSYLEKIANGLAGAIVGYLSKTGALDSNGY